MVSAVRKGTSIRQAAKRFGVARATVQYWLSRAGDARLDRVDFGERPRGPRQPANRVDTRVEEQILALRRDLMQLSALGEFGAEAIHREMRRRQIPQTPSVRTIGRILERRGALDGRKRTRRPPSPPGWYLPEAADALAELSARGLFISTSCKTEDEARELLRNAETWSRDRRVG